MVAIFLIARLIYAPLGEKQSSTPLDEILVVFVGLAAPFGVRALARSGRGVRFLVCFIAYASVLLASSYLHQFSFERGANFFYFGLALDMKFFALFFGAYAFAAHRAREDGVLKTVRFIMWEIGRASCRERVCQYV